ncbi:hypothetical protein DCAR_0520876 [Daucus carota subsp. sativus]|uniref:Uncharacterized protein n=1 Tax=Daucus carota subsp. sativus TaxID=79200 RepID=A0A164YWA2_DAUCS|nr:hypothetical protein DCAR_0520876 [Daucus carota subsp. sativus]
MSVAYPPDNPISHQHFVLEYSTLIHQLQSRFFHTLHVFATNMLVVVVVLSTTIQADRDLAIS